LTFEGVVCSRTKEKKGKFFAITLENRLVENSKNSLDSEHLLVRRPFFDRQKWVGKLNIFNIYQLTLFVFKKRILYDLVHFRLFRDESFEKILFYFIFQGKIIFNCITIETFSDQNNTVFSVHVMILFAWRCQFLKIDFSMNRFLSERKIVPMVRSVFNPKHNFGLVQIFNRPNVFRR
jgi:hypothetical protein